MNTHGYEIDTLRPLRLISSGPIFIWSRRGAETDGAAKMANTMDITGISDTVLDASIALRTGDDTFDFDALTFRELVEVQAVTGVSLAGWIAAARRSDVAAAVAGRDYEGAILARQEDDGRNVG